MSIFNIPTPEQVATAFGRPLTEAENVFFEQLKPLLGGMQSQMDAELDKMQAKVSEDLFAFLKVITKLRIVDGLKIEGSFSVKFIREPETR